MCLKIPQSNPHGACACSCAAVCRRSARLKQRCSMWLEQKNKIEQFCRKIDPAEAWHKQMYENMRCFCLCHGSAGIFSTVEKLHAKRRDI